MPEFTDALDKARTELAKLRRERQLLDVKIRKMEQLVGALNTVNAEDDDDVEMLGITDAIRLVLKQSRVVMSATAIRDALKNAGFDFVERYGSNLIQAVHVVLKRLVKSEEVMEIDRGDYAERTYWWALNGTPKSTWGSLADLMNMASPDTQEAFAVAFPNTDIEPPPPGPQRRRLTETDPDLTPPRKPVMRKLTTESQLRRQALLDKMKEKK